MNTKVTKKFVNGSYEYKISVPYCALQFLLNSKSPIGHTEEIEGWGADIYEVDWATVIVTGRAPFGNIVPHYADCYKYNDAARRVLDDHSLSYKETQSKLDELLRQFVDEVC